MKILNYGRHHITDADKKAVCDALDSDYITQGPLVAEFEKKFTEYIKVKGIYAEF